MFEQFSILARQAVMIARKEAGRVGAGSIDTEHLLIGILCVHPELDQQLGIEIQVGSIRKRSERWHLPSTPIPNSRDLPVTHDLNRIFERASLDADGQRCRETRTEHLLSSMLEEPGHATELLVESWVTKEKLLALMSKVDCNGTQVGTDASLAAMKSIFEAV